MLSAVGDQLYTVALAWIGVTVLGANAGYLTALQALVALLAVLGVGRWADRWDRRRSMMGADLLRGLALVAVVLCWAARGRPSVLQLVCAIVVLATGEAVFDPALQGLLPSLIEDARLLPAANGLFDATDRGARLVGPGLIALLAGIVPIMHFLTLDAVSFFASAAALCLVRSVAADPSPSVTAPQREGFRANIRRGIRAMRAHPLLGYALATAGFSNGAWYAVFFLALPFLIRQHGVSSPGGSSLGAYGLVISAYGCTNLLATVVIGSRPPPERPQYQMYAGNLLVGCGVALLGFAPFLPNRLALAGLMISAAVGAIGGPMKDIPLAVLRQTRLARADLGAAMRAYMAASMLGTLTALVLAPELLTALGPEVVVVACGAVILIVGAIGLLRFTDWIERYGAPVV